MPTLIVQTPARVFGVSLPRRTLIGRRSMNHLRLDDPGVSRMHAWIDQTPAGWVVTDMHSRTGTTVNGRRLAGPQSLNDGDVLGIGAARLKFLLADALPAEVPSEPLPISPDMSPRDAGIRFDCPHCRAPMWAATQYAGFGGICTYCNDGFTIPRLPVVGNAPLASSGPVSERSTRAERQPPAVEPPARKPASSDRRTAERAPVAAAQTPAVTGAASTAGATASSTPSRAAPASRRARQCGICQSPIETGEPTHTCPSCHLTFHEDCWLENYGCSSYGCPQVNALAPPEVETAAGDPTEVATDDLPPAGTPREFIYLGLSVLAVVIGAFTFGLASAVMLAINIRFARQRSGQVVNRGATLGALGLSAVGIVAGVIASYFVFLYGKR